MLCDSSCAVLIIVLSLIVSFSSLAVIIRYKNRTIPMNSFAFGLIFFSGLFSAIFYFGVVTESGGLWGFNFIQASRVKQFYGLFVFSVLIINALVVRKPFNGGGKS